MSRKCEICGKHTVSGGSIVRKGTPKKQGGIGLNTKAHNKRKFKPNIQKIRALVNGTVKRIKVCTACMRSGKVVKPPLSTKV